MLLSYSHQKRYALPLHKILFLNVILIIVGLLLSCGNKQEIGPDPEFSAAADRLEAAIETEIELKQLPSFSIALADGDGIIWAKAFGNQNENRPASTETIYRIASVSKLFTDLAVMQLAERGELDIDAPVRNYVPEFEPDNSFGVDITLRHLMSHRSGLIREPAVGNYFDPTEPDLEQMVLSLKGAPVVYEPETKTKYSNAAIGLAGYVIEKVKGVDFSRYMQDNILNPIGMTNSSFLRNEQIDNNLATAIMWRYDGNEFPAPVFEFGFLPAANIYTSMPELAKFMMMLMNDGAGIVSPETLQEMFTPQFGGGYAIGFGVNRFDGHLRVRHGGAVYGFATDFNVLPEEKLGVCASASRDVSNAVVKRLSEYALRLMLAVKNGEELPEYKLTEAVNAELAARLDGKYRNINREIELHDKNGRLYIETDRMIAELRQFGDILITDDRHSYGLEVIPSAGGITVNGDMFRKVDVPRPPAVSAQWKSLIGEYGWDHNILYIYEKNGRMHALIEWTEIDPLTEIEQDLFAFPNFGMYHGEYLEFRRDSDGKVKDVVAAGIVFERRDVGTADGETFTITPVRPVEEIREEAVGAVMPVFEGEFLESDLVELQPMDPSMKLDMRYASNNNFMQATFYSQPKAFLQRPAAEAVVRANRKLEPYGYGLLIHDAYRPWYVTKMFWDATPEDMKIFVANPATGSIHNRGGAVDLTLYDLKTGEPVEMVAGFDEFSDRSFADYVGGTSLQRWHRELLRTVMESEGFTVYQWEWWHFNHADARKYPVMNIVFEDIK